MSFISPVAVDSNGQPRATGSLQSLGKDDFLSLLVTKLQHQDPLDPMNDEGFIAQLAQFSSLEQMNNISEGIATSNQWDFMQMQSLNNAMAAGLIGREVKADYNGIYYDQFSNPTIAYTAREAAQEITFTIRDAEGNVVNTLTAENVQPGVGKIVWDGTDSTGNRVAEGYYQVEASGKNLAGDNIELELGLLGIVRSISYQNGAAFLDIDGTKIPLSDVQGIGAPGTFSGNDEE